MKTAIYIEQGVTQLVLTPESKWEESVVDSIADKRDERNASVFITRGCFYHCQGGWDRQGSNQDSLIIRHVVKKAQ